MLLGVVVGLGEVLDDLAIEEVAARATLHRSGVLRASDDSCSVSVSFNDTRCRARARLIVDSDTPASAAA
jgi:AraC-like DNA-binding protein